MSYRELRNFIEILRTLGYPRIVSIENFRTPNFELVADLLYWMVKLYDPDSAISDRVEFESERIEFLTSIEALMASKARLKLNSKKLYAADGRAVQEMLKIATLLYSGVKLANKPDTEETTVPPIKLQDVKTVRTIASQLTQSGAKLYDLLSSEAVDRQDRLKALRFLDAVVAAPEGSRDYVFVEKSLKEVVETARQRVEDVKKECEELELDEKNIKTKIHRKQEELERTEKRIRSMDHVRPQFMEEVDKLEQELSRYYDIYIEKYRNLDYLNYELEKYRKQEEEKKEQQMTRINKMRERLLKEEVELLRGGGSSTTTTGHNNNGNVNGNTTRSGTKSGGMKGGKYKGSQDDDEDDVYQTKRGPTKAKRLGGRKNGQSGSRGINNNNNRGRGGQQQPPPRSGVKVQGRMLGPDDDDDSEEDSIEDEEQSEGEEEDSYIGSELDEAEDDEELSVASDYNQPKRNTNATNANNRTTGSASSYNPYNKNGYRGGSGGRGRQEEEGGSEGDEEDDDEEDGDEDDDDGDNDSNNSDDHF